MLRPAVVEVREIPQMAVSAVETDLPLSEQSARHVDVRVGLVSDATSLPVNTSVVTSVFSCDSNSRNSRSLAPSQSDIHNFQYHR